MRRLIVPTLLMLLVMLPTAFAAVNLVDVQSWFSFDTDMVDSNGVPLDVYPQNYYGTCYLGVV